MPVRPHPRARASVKGVGWTRPITIAGDKYARLSRAILASVPAEPIRFTELVRRVERRLPGFEGSIAWYAITVARELEAQGKLLRQEKPVLYAKVAGPSSKGPAGAPAAATPARRRALRL